MIWYRPLQTLLAILLAAATLGLLAGLAEAGAVSAGIPLAELSASTSTPD